MNLIEAKNILTHKKSKNDQLLGERKGSVQNLKKISGTSSLELAEKKTKQLTSQVKKEETEYIKDVELFEKTFGHLLKEN